MWDFRRNGTIPPHAATSCVPIGRRAVRTGGDGHRRSPLLPGPRDHRRQARRDDLAVPRPRATPVDVPAGPVGAAAPAAREHEGRPLLRQRHVATRLAGTAATSRRRQRPGGASARTGAAFTAEASPYYLFHPLAARACRRSSSPTSRFVVMLRDPVERTVSHWAEQTRNGVETLSLREALDAEPTGSATRRTIGRRHVSGRVTPTNSRATPRRASTPPRSTDGSRRSDATAS